MKKRFLSVIVALSLVLTCMALPAFGANAFPDVTSPGYDWAAEQINKMTEVGIIRGYSDGTFKPGRAISKIEALLLFSRVAGFSDDQYASCIDFATDKYKYALEDVDLGIYDSYKAEISFLIYKGVMDEEELVAYVDDGAYSEEFPRKDAAMFLANLMNAEIKSVRPSSLDFADADEISSEYAGYIAYVYENGFMNGIATDDGGIAFKGDAPLSRAQVCVLLYRIMEKLDMSVESGVVTKVNVDGGTISFEKEDGTVDSYIIPIDAKLLVDGVESTLDKVLTNSEIVFVRHGRDMYSVEVINPESNVTVKGTVVAFVSRANFIKLSLQPEGSESVVNYYANSEFKVTSDGVVDDIDSIKVDDFVVVKLLGNDIVSVERQTEEATVQGKVEALSLTNPLTLSVLTVDETSKRETIFDYTVAENVSVRRNNEPITLRELRIGDEVVLTIKRGNITRIVATSSVGAVSGSVTGIKIAAQSSVTIASGGIEKEYPIAFDAEFIIGSSIASIYELRLGNMVKLTLASGTATKVEQTSASSVTTKSGVVENLSTSYGYITIASADINGVNSEQIFVSKTGSSVTAKILNGETGKEIALKNIKAGDQIIATGAYTNGAFVAKTIVVTPIAK